jgi:NAD(P)-dependent dehydrogenase (short-subunit alcohol dehydrogenase family)
MQNEMQKGSRALGYGIYMTRSALIVGSGGTLGQHLSHSLIENENYAVYSISSSIPESEKVLHVDWSTCNIASFEKFLRRLPKLDLVIFNQKPNALPDACLSLDDSILNVWKQSQTWGQNHYVNCIFPFHALHTLFANGSIGENSIITWVLSAAIKDLNPNGPIDYIGQKFQNYVTLKALANKNSPTFIGICPGDIQRDIVQNTIKQKSDRIVRFLTTELTQEDTGKFFDFEIEKFLE